MFIHGMDEIMVQKNGLLCLIWRTKWETKQPLLQQVSFYSEVQSKLSFCFCNWKEDCRDASGHSCRREKERDEREATRSVVVDVGSLIDV